MKAIELIAKERNRQKTSERFSLKHDDKHVDDELALAAACYAIPEDRRQYEDTPNGGEIPMDWPWEEKDWKPMIDFNYEKLSSFEGRIKELVKAGALIVAEIERLQRGIKHSK